MIDRSANLRAIVTGRGNRADFTPGWRAAHKKQAHKRMRLSGKEQIKQQLDEMNEDQFSTLDSGYELFVLVIWSSDELNEQTQAELKHKERLAARRARYHQRKVARQVADYQRLLKELKKLNKKLAPESRLELSAKGELLRLG